MSRIAIVADVHGSLAALEAVVEDLRRQSPDLIVHGGDLVVSGPRPAEVIDRIRELGWPGVVGNTDEILWAPERRAEQEARAPRLAGLLHLLFDDLAPATAERIGHDRIEWLKTLPERWSSEDIALVHASPGDLWRAPMPDATDDEFSDVYSGLGAKTVVYCHIHRPHVRAMSDLVVANTGSTGLSYDGDARASYLLVDEGRPTIKRVPYDIEADIADLHRTAYPHADWLAGIKRTGRYRSPK